MTRTTPAINLASNSDMERHWRERNIAYLQAELLDLHAKLTRVEAITGLRAQDCEAICNAKELGNTHSEQWILILRICAVAEKYGTYKNNHLWPRSVDIDIRRGHHPTPPTLQGSAER